MVENLRDGREYVDAHAAYDNELVWLKVNLDDIQAISEAIGDCTFMPEKAKKHFTIGLGIMMLEEGIPRMRDVVRYHDMLEDEIKEKLDK